MDMHLFMLCAQGWYNWIMNSERLRKVSVYLIIQASTYLIYQMTTAARCVRENRVQHIRPLFCVASLSEAASNE